MSTSTTQDEPRDLSALSDENLVFLARDFVEVIENGIAYNNLTVEESAALARDCLANVVTELHSRALEIARNEQDPRRRDQQAYAAEIVSGEWEQEIPDEDGTDVWSFSSEYGDRAEDYYAEVTGHGPSEWAVGECFPAGRLLETGKAETLKQAQHDAEQAWKRAVQDDLS